jgi:HAD superfamily hydrolase (TIGR01509 family)
MPRVNCILSDIGKVVYDYDNGKTVRGFQAHSPHPAAYIDSVLFHPGHGLCNEFERGGMTTEDFRTAVRLALNLDEELHDDEFDHIYSDIFWPIDEVIVLWERIRRRRGPVITAVSNIDWLRLAPLEEMRYDEHFDHLILSCERKLAKPSEELMVQALDLSGVKAEEAVFIDDKPENLLPAKDIGIRTHCYQGFEGLKAFLTENGLAEYLQTN